MLGFCCPQVGFRSLPEANPQRHLAPWRAAPERGGATSAWEGGLEPLQRAIWSCKMPEAAGDYGVSAYKRHVTVTVAYFAVSIPSES